jgi:hypothetical protein
MHNEKLIDVGIRKIGIHEYWKSFHIVNKGIWTTQAEAITELVSIFPGGKIFRYLTTVEPMKNMLLKTLNLMQRVRKSECTQR